MMTVFKWIFAILVALPMLAIFYYFFMDLLNTALGVKKAEKEKKNARREAAKKGFTIHIPSSDGARDSAAQRMPRSSEERRHG